MDTAIAVRDAVFWWIGDWALITGLDIAVVLALKNRAARQRKRAEERAEAMRVMRAPLWFPRNIRRERKHETAETPDTPTDTESGEQEHHEAPAE